jgi:hypothetical protein
MFSSNSRLLCLDGRRPLSNCCSDGDGGKVNVSLSAALTISAGSNVDGLSRTLWSNSSASRWGSVRRSCRVSPDVWPLVL